MHKAKGTFPETEVKFKRGARVSLSSPQAFFNATLSHSNSRMSTDKLSSNNMVASGSSHSQLDIASAVEDQPALGRQVEALRALTLSDRGTGSPRPRPKHPKKGAVLASSTPSVSSNTTAALAGSNMSINTTVAAFCYPYRQGTGPLCGVPTGI